ncbi:SDR family oxidoreductase [Salinifilum aidingensis]
MTERPLALVTGASRGIGAATARALSETHDVLLGGRDSATLEQLAREIPGTTAWPVELTDHSAVAAAAERFDRLDALVHSAGVADLGTIEETPAETWQRTFRVNLFAVTELTRQLLPALRAARGHVVLVNSGAGLSAKPGWGAYAASKFALRGFADSLRAEESQHGVKVTSIFPGRVATDMQREVRRQEGGTFEPEGYLRPDSVARSIVSSVHADEDTHLTEVVLRPA